VRASGPRTIRPGPAPRGCGSRSHGHDSDGTASNELSVGFPAGAMRSASSVDGAPGPSGLLDAPAPPVGQRLPPRPPGGSSRAPPARARLRLATSTRSSGRLWAGGGRRTPPSSTARLLAQRNALPSRGLRAGRGPRSALGALGPSSWARPTAIGPARRFAPPRLELLPPAASPRRAGELRGSTGRGAAARLATYTARALARP